MAEKQTKKRVSGGKTTGKSSGSRKCTSKSSRAKANARTPVRREVGARDVPQIGPFDAQLRRQTASYR